MASATSYLRLMTGVVGAAAVEAAKVERNLEDVVDKSLVVLAARGLNFNALLLGLKSLEPEDDDAGVDETD